MLATIYHPSLVEAILTIPILSRISNYVIPWLGTLIWKFCTCTFCKNLYKHDESLSLN